MEKKCAAPTRPEHRPARQMRRKSSRTPKPIPLTESAHQSPSGWAQALGYGGLIPFVSLAVAVWTLEPIDRARSLSALLAYGASILGFMGAVHWGLVMRDASGGRSTRSLVWGVTPALVAWIALLVDPVVGLWLVAAGLWSCFAVDRVTYPNFGVRGWLPMRLVLTVVASLCCAAGAVRLMQ